MFGEGPLRVQKMDHCMLKHEELVKDGSIKWVPIGLSVVNYSPALPHFGLRLSSVDRLRIPQAKLAFIFIFLFIFMLKYYFNFSIIKNVSLN